MAIEIQGGITIGPGIVIGPVDTNLRRTTGATSLAPFTFTGVNGANYSTSKAQFGAGSLDATSASSYLTYNTGPWTGPWPSGTGDFCIEGWAWIPSGRSSAAADTAAVVCNNSTVAVGFRGGLCVRFGAGSGVGGINNIGIFGRGLVDLDYVAYTWPRDQWVHWAAQRKSGYVSFWANGSRLYKSNAGLGSTYDFLPPGTVGPGYFNFGASIASAVGSPSGTGPPSSEPLLGWMDEVCVSNSWRYDDSYTTYVVPMAAFYVDTLTDLLIHFDSSLTTAAT